MRATISWLTYTVDFVKETPARITPFDVDDRLDELVWLSQCLD
jgi:hypothetical protein